MRRAVVMMVIVCLALSLGVVGCTKKAATAQEAIQNVKSIEDVEAQVKYLVGQANAFVSSKEFDQAIQAAQYILSNLDQNSAQAKSIIEMAKEKMAAEAQKAMDDVKSKIAGFGQ